MPSIHTYMCACMCSKKIKLACTKIMAREGLGGLIANIVSVRQSRFSITGVSNFDDLYHFQYMCIRSTFKGIVYTNTFSTVVAAQTYIYINFYLSHDHSADFLRGTC